MTERQKKEIRAICRSLEADLAQASSARTMHERDARRILALEAALVCLLSILGERQS